MCEESDTQIYPYMLDGLSCKCKVNWELMACKDEGKVTLIG